jgi:glutamate--cysteine ligase
VDEILRDIREKYAEYGVEEDPFVIVKADAGTYGMGVMTVKDGAEVRTVNRRRRNKMAVVKEGLQVTEVIVQEGVYTFERVNEAVAEPVIYMVHRYVVGGFYRVHKGRGIDENLNRPVCSSCRSLLKIHACCRIGKRGGLRADLFYAYGVIARLALLAAAQELEKSPIPASAIIE